VGIFSPSSLSVPSRVRCFVSCREPRPWRVFRHCSPYPFLVFPLAPGSFVGFLFFFVSLGGLQWCAVFGPPWKNPPFSPVSFGPGVSDLLRENPSPPDTSFSPASFFFRKKKSLVTVYGGDPCGLFPGLPFVFVLPPFSFPPFFLGCCAIRHFFYFGDRVLLVMGPDVLRGRLLENLSFYPSIVPGIPPVESFFYFLFVPPTNLLHLRENRLFFGLCPFFVFQFPCALPPTFSPLSFLFHVPLSVCFFLLDAGSTSPVK